MVAVTKPPARNRALSSLFQIVSKLQPYFQTLSPFGPLAITPVSAQLYTRIPASYYYEEGLRPMVIASIV